MLFNEKKNQYINGMILLYSLSLIISKFGISLFSALLLLILGLTAPKKEKEDTYIFIFIFILGLIFQLFSAGGIKSFLVFSYKNYFLMLVPFTIYYLNNNNNISDKILKAIEIGLFLGILKSFYNFYSIYNLKYSAYIRVDSFFDIGRWGLVLVMGLLLILPNLYRKKYFSWLVFILGIFSLILNNSRAPLLSFVLGILFYLIFSQKMKTLLFIIIFSIFMNQINHSDKIPTVIREFSKRIETIFKTDSGGNAARIFMWKENINFMLDSSKNNKKIFLFGTGIKNREIPFKEYLINKIETKELEKFRKWGVSFIDAHNAYLNMLVQTGVIYTIIYYLTLLYFTIKVFLNFLTSKNEYTLSCLTAMGAFYFSGIFYGYSFTYETFLFFFVLSLGLTKKLMDNNSGINDSE